MKEYSEAVWKQAHFHNTMKYLIGFGDGPSGNTDGEGMGNGEDMMYTGGGDGDGTHYILYDKNDTIMRGTGMGDGFLQMYGNGTGDGDGRGSFAIFLIRSRRWIENT